MDLQLYSYFRSSCSYRVRIALEYKELNYKYLPIHLVKDGGEQHSSQYAELNPSKEVPLLIHYGEKISQSMAIMMYLDDIVPENPIFPRYPIDKAKVVELCEMINSGIQPKQNLNVMQTLTNMFNIDSTGVSAWNKHWIERGFRALEKKLQKTAGSFCLGGQLTAADMFLVPQVYNAHRFHVDMTEFPIIAKIERNCMQLECFKKAAPENQPDAPK